MQVATSYFQSNTDLSQHALAHHLAAAAGGDSQAFGQVVDATRNVVCSLALAVVRDVRVSEDIAQEVYLAVWKGLHTLRNPNSFLPWIRQLTRHVSIEHLRRFGRREKKHLPGAHAQDALSQVVDPAAHPETALLQREQALLVAEAIDSLPEDSREVVILFYREGCSVEQVSRLIHMSEGAVKKRLSRARQALRNELFERLGESLRQSMPGAAFTVGVTTCIALGTPSAAAAAGFGAATSLGTGTAFAKILSLVSGVVFGFGSAAGAVWFGISRLLNKSVDAHETSSLRRFRWVNLALVALAFLGFQVGPLVLPLPWSSVVPFAVYAVALSLSYRWWLPRILAARLAAERLHDHQAIQVQRRNSMKSWAGLIIGLTLGSLGVYFGLKQAGWTP
jgi:RNA polymerase sigma factor (sigma-70 family)